MYNYSSKVQLIWEVHKNLRNHPYGFDNYLVNVKTILGRFRKFLWSSQKSWTLYSSIIFSGIPIRGHGTEVIRGRAMVAKNIQNPIVFSIPIMGFWIFLATLAWPRMNSVSVAWPKSTIFCNLPQRWPKSVLI